jgi:hypothetical protein
MVQAKNMQLMDRHTIECMENSGKMKDLCKAIVVQSSHYEDTNKTIGLLRSSLELSEICDLNLLLLANKSPNSLPYFHFFNKVVKRQNKEFQEIEKQNIRDFGEMRKSFQTISNNILRNMRYLKKNN